MSQLEEDLEKYADEAFNKKDIKAAIKLVAEITGGISVLYVSGIVIGALFGPGGVATISAGALYGLYYKCCEAYTKLPTDQRILVRKLAKAIRGLM